MTQRERLAELCHKQWSGWMDYLFSKGTFDFPGGTWTMPQWAVERWRRQAMTPYAELSQEERDSDGKEADRFIALLSQSKSEGPCSKCNAAIECNFNYCPHCGLFLRPRCPVDNNAPTYTTPTADAPREEEPLLCRECCGVVGATVYLASGPTGQLHRYCSEKCRHAGEHK